MTSFDHRNYLGRMLRGDLQRLSQHNAVVHHFTGEGGAGDLCAKEIGQYGMLPTDMVLVLPRLLK